MANFYFLIMILLQIVPGIGQKNGALMTSLPLMFVVGISMIKDIFEDNKRRSQDEAENN